MVNVPTSMSTPPPQVPPPRMHCFGLGLAVHWVTCVVWFPLLLWSPSLSVLGSVYLQAVFSSTTKKTQQGAIVCILRHCRTLFFFFFFFLSFSPLVNIRLTEALCQKFGKSISFYLFIYLFKIISPIQLFFLLYSMGTQLHIHVHILLSYIIMLPSSVTRHSSQGPLLLFAWLGTFLVLTQMIYQTISNSSEWEYANITWK